MKPRILSGVRATGDLHIGNYLGAIKQWVDLQKDYDTFFTIVDQHSITTHQDPDELKRYTLEIAKLYFACGLDQEKSTVFVQSHVPAHTELAWMFMCLTKVAEMERMTQFKDKSAKNKEGINVGLMSYPVLMAADILLYQPELVPVGEDQTQHLEFARTIGRRFNKKFKTGGEDTFRIPKQFTPPEGARIMSLSDPSEKMSKSDRKPSATINMLDDAETIKKKIKKAVTDSGDEIVYSDKKPALKNLINIYSSFSGQGVKEVEAHYKGTSYKLFKEGLARVITEGLRPIQERYAELDRDPSLLHGLLQNGAEKANGIASTSLRNAKDAMGFVRY